VSIVELVPLLTIGTHIVKNVIFMMMSGERRGPWASCFQKTPPFTIYQYKLLLLDIP